MKRRKRKSTDEVEVEEEEEEEEGKMVIARISMNITFICFFSKNINFSLLSIFPGIAFAAFNFIFIFFSQLNIKIFIFTHIEFADSFYTEQIGRAHV